MFISPNTDRKHVGTDAGSALIGYRKADTDTWIVEGYLPDGSVGRVIEEMINEGGFSENDLAIFVSPDKDDELVYIGTFVEALSGHQMVVPSAVYNRYEAAGPFRRKDVPRFEGVNTHGATDMVLLARRSFEIEHFVRYVPFKG